MSVASSVALLVITVVGALMSGCRFCEAQGNITEAEVQLYEFALNLEYLEAEFFLFGSRGYGLDRVAPDLVKGGPPPIGARAARLDPFTKDVIYQFGLQKVGNIRATQNLIINVTTTIQVTNTTTNVTTNVTTTIPVNVTRPSINLSKATFAGFMNRAFGRPLFPPFDPYANPINYLLASYIFPYVSVTTLVGANYTTIQSPDALELAAGLLGTNAGQDGVIRSLLYSRAGQRVRPYRVTIAEFTDRISELRNSLGGTGAKDEGLVVAPSRGPEGRSRGNVLAGDQCSLSYGRTAPEVLRILYVSGNESVPGGFFPNGANGNISSSFLPQ